MLFPPPTRWEILELSSDADVDLMGKLATSMVPGLRLMKRTHSFANLVERLAPTASRRIQRGPSSLRGWSRACKVALRIAQGAVIGQAGTLQLSL